MASSTAAAATSTVTLERLQAERRHVDASENDAVVESWGRPGGDVIYVVLEDAAVDEDVRAAAVAGRALATAHLGIGSPGMRFYLPEGPTERAYLERYGCRDWPAFAGREWNGHADRTTHTIGVRADIDPELAVEVAVHECFHLTQAGEDPDAEEDEAMAYGEWAAAILVGRRGVAETVHVHEGPLWRRHTLAGVAAHGDVMVAIGDDGTRAVCRNAGYGESVDWFEHEPPPTTTEQTTTAEG